MAGDNKSGAFLPPAATIYSRIPIALGFSDFFDLFLGTRRILRLRYFLEFQPFPPPQQDHVCIPQNVLSSIFAPAGP
jgi:hypothetical protein